MTRKAELMDTTGARATSVFVILNARSGSCDRDEARRVIEGHFAGESMACRVYEPGHDDRLADRVREAVASGCDLVGAAGADGTVSAVAEALAGTETPLGIIPLGTANVLARELGVPVELNAACALLDGDQRARRVARLDTMELNGRSYLTQIGVGLDALMIRDTATEHKRRFGRLAYLWTAATRLVGIQPRRFALTVDGVTSRVRATQVLVANVGLLGQPPFRWGPNIRPDDGVLDVCLIRARNLWDYTRLTWTFLTGRHKSDPNVKYLTARREIRIATISPKPLPVQGDGEIVGETPLTVRTRAGALRVVVPPVDASTG